MFSGKFVAPNIKRFLLSFPTPYIYTRNSVLILLLDSFSSPPPLAETRESISSINITALSSYLAISNIALTKRSDSP